MALFLSSASAAGTAAQFITVLVIFIIVLLLTYFATRYVGSYQKMQSPYRNFEMIESYRVSANKYLQIVRAANKYFVIAVGKDEISFITELNEDELILTADDKALSTDFKALLKNFKDKVRK